MMAQDEPAFLMTEQSMRKLVLSITAALFLTGAVAPVAFAESELEKGVRHDNRELDKGVDHDAKEVDKGVKHDADEVDKGAKHDDKERHKADKHIDKEVKKDL
ncbi:hypothetical protein A979_04301 [Pseudomonas syringae BRIP34876]|nr:hypothetical protein A979_04301 [Pseudomonas syringae BRIP34876]ELQ04331.1 hypothetical protein A987_08693 [Pseudomonas syringae BRIP34881]